MLNRDETTARAKRAAPTAFACRPPDILTEEQKSLAADMKEGIARSFQGFANVRDDGALVGPWNPWMYHPRFGEPILDLTKAIAFSPSVPAAVREIAILATGTRFKAPMSFTHMKSWPNARGCPIERSRPL